MRQKSCATCDILKQNHGVNVQHMTFCSNDNVN